MTEKICCLPSIQKYDVNKFRPLLSPEALNEINPNIPFKSSVSPILLPKPDNYTSLRKLAKTRKISFDSRISVSEYKSLQKKGFNENFDPSLKSKSPKVTAVDENMMIQQKSSPLVRNMMGHFSVLDDSSVIEQKRKQGKNDSRMNIQVLAVSEEILSLYNINVELIYFPKFDSLMDIEEISFDKSKLSLCFKILVPLICKFPYSFLKRIELRILKFCQDVYLHKPCNDKMVLARLLSGIFPLDKLDTEEKITNYFFNVLVFHIKKAVPDFDAKWLDFEITERDELEFLKSSFLGQKNQRKKASLGSQATIIKHFFLVQHYEIASKIDILKLKKFFQELDPSGINEDWWLKLEESTLSESRIITSC